MWSWYTGDVLRVFFRRRIMPTKLPRVLLEIRYQEAARERLRNQTMEDIMEGTAQATQRKITLASLDLLQARRTDVHVFSELLVQYPKRGQKQPAAVVPDNMLVLYDG